jgi:hypothetical protein
LFKKKSKIEVVPESEYTDFSERESSSEYASKETFLVAALIPTTAILGYKVFANSNQTTTTIPNTIPVSTTPTVIEPVLTPISQTPTLALNETVLATPTGVIADTSLEVLATVLDPIIEILVSVSLPIASVIMVGSCFFFMFGNNERALDGIMKSAMGYILIQLSPLFLKILREVGESVVPQ